MKDKSEDKKLLEVKNLVTHFFTEDGVARAVDGVSFEIKRGETLALVGESGCGKSVTAFSIMRLVPDPPGKIVSGEILLNGKNLVALKESEMRRIRGNRIGMVFQEPMTSLNPVFKVGYQVAEAAVRHNKGSWKKARQTALEMLKKVEIPAPEDRMNEYPHQMSGGMKQRVIIAMALVCRPDLIIADEPTTALDVTIQAQILALMSGLQRELGMSILLITHDLGVVAQAAHRVAVMYAGKIVETASVEEVFKNPSHPYTLALMESIPRLGEKKKRLAVIPGEVSNPLQFPEGCRFNPRCAFARERCRAEVPELEEIRPGHMAACHFLEEVAEKGKEHVRS